MNITRKQHFIPCRHLKSWAANDQIYSCRNGRTFLSNLTGVANERDFYEVHDLDPSDIKMIHDIFLRDVNPEDRLYCLSWLSTISPSSIIRETIPYLGYFSKDQEEEIIAAMKEGMRHYKIQVGEMLQTHFENFGFPILEDIRLNKINQISLHGEDLQIFMCFIAMQYIRSKGMKLRLKRLFESIQALKNPEHCMNYLRLILSLKIASGMLHKKHQFKIIKNSCKIKFITGDQPIVNIHASKFDSETPTDNIELYYPISPDTALLVTDKITSILDINDSEVHAYNMKICEQAESSIFSNDKSLIEYYAKFVRSGTR